MTPDQVEILGRHGSSALTSRSRLARSRKETELPAHDSCTQRPTNGSAQHLRKKRRYGVPDLSLNRKPLRPRTREFAKTADDCDVVGQGLQPALFSHRQPPIAPVKGSAG